MGVSENAGRFGGIDKFVRVAVVVDGLMVPKTSVLLMAHRSPPRAGCPPGEPRPPAPRPAQCGSYAEALGPPPFVNSGFVPRVCQCANPNIHGCFSYRYGCGLLIGGRHIINLSNHEFLGDLATCAG
jgi:hypothetical protein